MSLPILRIVKSGACMLSGQLGSSLGKSYFSRRGNNDHVDSFIHRLCSNNPSRD